MSNRFEQFLQLYPAESAEKLNGMQLAKAVKVQFGLSIPATLREFWREVGSGYFGHRELYFFGEERKSAPRDSLLAWNAKDFWDEIFPVREDRPFFFAETSFGYQLGFRYVSRATIVELFSVDTFKVFLIAEDFNELFSEVFAEKHALTDEKDVKALMRLLGPLPDGMHYAPILSPLAGGTKDPANFHFETPNVHIRTALATYQALRSEVLKKKIRGGRKDKVVWRYSNKSRRRRSSTSPGVTGHPPRG